jgi:hypothetical protein
LQRNLVSVRVDSLTGDYDQVRSELGRFLPRTGRSPITLLCTRINGGVVPNAQVAAPERTFAGALTTVSGRTANAVVYNADRDSRCAAHE